MEGLWEASDDAVVLGGGAEEAMSDLIQREEEEEEEEEEDEDEGGRGRSSSSGRRGVGGEIDGDWNGKQKKDSTLLSLWGFPSESFARVLSEGIKIDM
jgi:hypothetical protein